MLFCSFWFLLCKRPPYSATQNALENLSLDIDSGENLFVIGGSGSGKSVLRFSQGPQGFILRFDQDKLQTVADLLQLSLAYASLSLFFGKNM